MVYTDTWNTAFEAIPADSEDIGQGAERIRDLKLALRERLEKDHYFDAAGTDADHGEHKWITLREQATDPTAVADKGFVYAKAVAATTELFYEDAAGNKIQLTSAGSINLSVPTAFAAGTKMYFFQAAAPTGWTYDSAVTDRCLAVKGGTGLYNVAGGVQAGAWTHDHGVGSHTHSVSLISTGTVDISHTHTTTASGAVGEALVVPAAAFSGSASVSVSGSGTSGGGSGSVDANTAFRPYAAVGIIATKD
jgi:hypothetical protein